MADDTDRIDEMVNDLDDLKTSVESGIICPVVFERTKMLPLWGRIHVPVIYMQGAEDGLVDTSNASFAKEHLTNVPYLDIRMIPGRGHLIAFAEKDRIEKAILEMLDRCERKH